MNEIQSGYTIKLPGSLLADRRLLINQLTPPVHVPTCWLYRDREHNAMEWAALMEED